jgi:predicted metalloprotease
MFSGGRLAGGGIIGLIIVVVGYFLGIGDGNLSTIFQQQPVEQSQQAIPASDTMAQFISVALADNEDVWKKLFSEIGKTYEEPTLVLFRGSTESGCGFASSASGPFYCPEDRKIYIDLSFFDDLKNRLGAIGGDFAIAYVLAHEVGHHVQNLLGISGQIHDMQQRRSEKEANKLSVALELHADYLAGVWAHYADKYKGVLEAGDIDEALSAASAVGDDRIQKQTQGHVVPDSFTHGTSEQRISAFKQGYQSGELRELRELR